MGIFAGSGVGKSTLLAQITRGTDADVRVIGLIGERGREVREFLEENLGAEGMARTVVVVATSDEPPLVRLKAAFVATRIAEAFRDQGRDVLLLMDSITRTAMAQREVGLSAGEPPATRGYPPSVFAMMPMLLEKATAIVTGNQPIVSTFSDEANEERYWEIREFSRVPCGGTHLKRTGEIGAITLKRKNIGKGKERIEIFVDEQAA